MKRPKHFLFPAITAIVAFICFAVVYYLMIKGTVLPPYVGLIFIIPALVFTVIAVLSYTGCIHHVASYIATGVLIPTLAIGSAVVFIMILFATAVTDTTAPADYEKVYGMYDISSVFPEEIPEDAENVEFDYYPAFLQGGGEIYLRYSDDAADIGAVGDKLAEDAVWWGDFNDFSEWEEYPPYFGDPEYFFSEVSLPDGTVIYLMEFSNSCEPDEDGYDWWNHGTYMVVAIFPEKSEIIYKFTWW